MGGVAFDGFNVGAFDGCIVWNVGAFDAFFVSVSDSDNVGIFEGVFDGLIDRWW